jgi:FkbM family methyltransferase
MSAYEPEMCEAIKRLAKFGSVCADIGANAGIMTDVMADAAGASGKVYAFEAHPDTAKALAGRMLSSRGNSVVVVHAAVTDGASKTIWLHPGCGNRSEEWNVVGHDVQGNPTPKTIEVPAVCLDDYFRSCYKLDVVKIDVEGAEDMVIRGMTRVLAALRPFVLVEFHNDEGWSSGKSMCENGYSIFALYHGGKRIFKFIDPTETGRMYHCLAVPDEKIPEVESWN